MCGICGAVGVKQGYSAIQSMTAAMIHRGPDSAGYLDCPLVTLGVRRLRIIDLDTGDQPIYNEDRSIAIVFNGEIYNFRTLFEELQAAGHCFYTRSDTEVILHAYEEWGYDCPQHLRGMFAFAIYDSRPRADGSARLFIARDRLGIKPLYVCFLPGGGLLFASEVRALLASGMVPRKLSIEGLYTYLAYGSVQEPLTLVEGVRSLPPASWLLVEIKKDTFHCSQATYWQPPPYGGSKVSPVDVLEWLHEAVRCHLNSDVPLGAFLSSGLDSGSIVALSSQVVQSLLCTFTMAFEDWPLDERHLAGEIAKRWQTSHQCRIISNAEVLADLPRALSDMDQPTTDGINSWYVSREARRAGLTVALSGVGGDELFAGYPSFKQVPQLKHLPVPLPWLKRLYGPGQRWLSAGNDSSRKLLAYLVGDFPLPHPYFAVRALRTQQQIEHLLTPQAREHLHDRSLVLSDWLAAVEEQLHLAAGYDAVGEVSWLEMSQYMRSTLLRDTDMMSMAHSLEVRVPYVDHRLIECILPLDGRLKFRRNAPKRLLRQAVASLLPPEVLAQPKRTFTFPFERWLKAELADHIEQALQESASTLGFWLKPEQVMAVWHAFRNGQTNWVRPWSLYVLGQWICTNL